MEAVHNTPLWSLYMDHGSLESVHSSLFFASSLESAHSTSSLESARSLSRGSVWIREIYKSLFTKEG